MPGGYQGRRGGPPKNNDDGSSTASIPKQFYDTIRKRIDDFKVGPTDRLTLEPMDRAQRKAVHDMANRLRVISKSFGEGSSRYCVISRRAAATMQAASLCSESEPVALTHEQKKAIVAFIKEYPISDEDIDAHVSVASEARDGVRESRKFPGQRAEALIPPLGNPSPDVQRTRHELPAFQARDCVIKMIEQNMVTLITGGTGCGKTTQVPQFLLERATELKTPVRIICTQPRRLPAIAVAQRVAVERREPLGSTVGYHIRLEQKTSASTVLTYCTSGVLLRMLTQDELARDCTHIILDEVHEREQNTDYLLIALKHALKMRKDLKVILMSATMEGNLQMFLNYFRDSNIVHVDIPSRLYPVTNFHLADVMALTGYTPPESVYGGGITTFSNGFSGFGGGTSSGFGGNNQSSGQGFAVGNWGGSSSFGGGRGAVGGDTFPTTTAWNNSDAKEAPQPSGSFQNGSSGGFKATPSNSASAAVSSTSVAAAAGGGGGGVRAVQSAANLPSYGNGAAAGNKSSTNAHFHTLAKQLASASGTNPLAASPAQQQQQPQQGGGAYDAGAAGGGGYHNGMQRSASLTANYAAQQQQQQQYGQPQQQQQPQQGYGNGMQQSGNGGGFYAQQLSWDSPSGYAQHPSSDVVDLPMDEDDKHMTMQANQQLYAASYGGGQQQQQQSTGGYQPVGFGPRGGGAAAGGMQPMQQQPQQYQGAAGYGAGYNQQPQQAPLSQQQMYGGMQQVQHQQPLHAYPQQQQAAGGTSGHQMYQYHQYQSQPNMQLHQPQPQQQMPQWPQQHSQQVSQQQQQPMFYVPDSPAVNAGGGFYGQQQQQSAFPTSNSMLGPSAHYQQQQPQQHGSSSFIHRSTSASASLNEVEQYAVSLREEENARSTMVAHVQNILPNKPRSFCEQSLEALEAAKFVLDRKAFYQFYRTMGGAQWEESVDVELAMVTVRYLMDSPVPGSILVFLPGYEDIQALKDKIIGERWDGLRPSLCLLHSQLNSNDQQRVFEPTRKGERKVILSTNIAEASLTIDDVVFVVDCGKAKEKTYDHASRISQLKCVWIAKSNAEQRRGRAGRCRPGYCFRLYADEEFDAMLPSQVAEMQRSAIHDVCLHAKMFAPEKMTVREFLQLAPEPPEAGAVQSSLQFLEQLGALYTEQTEDGGGGGSSSSSSFFGGRIPRPREPELTQLGRLVAHLPLDPQLARLLLFGYALRCFNPIVTLVALLSHRDPFTLAAGEEKQAALAARDSFAHRDFSDHLMILRAFTAYSALPSNAHSQSMQQLKMCREKYLSAPTLKMVNGIRRQLLQELRRIRFINEIDGALDDPFLNEHSNKWPMVQAAIVAGSYPCIGFVKGSKMRKIRTYTDAHSQLHPSSSLKRQMLSQEKRHEALQKYYMGEPTIEYLAFQEFVKIEEGLTLRTATAIPSVTIFLLAGPLRLCKDKLLSYFVSTREETLREEAEGQERDFFQPRDILELESWLSVKGCIGDFIRLMQLRFKTMEYVLSVMRKPAEINTDENKMLLSTLANVLDIEHKTKGFNEVTDIYVRAHNPLRKTDAGNGTTGYDFGANTSSSANSHREERKKQEQQPQQQQQKSYGNNNSAPSAFQHHLQQQQPRAQPQQQQQQRGKESAPATSQRANRDSMNWRSSYEARPQSSPTPPPLQQQPQQPKSDKVYPDPYRDNKQKLGWKNPRPQQQSQQKQQQQREEEKRDERYDREDNRGNRGGYGRDERRDSDKIEKTEERGAAAPAGKFKDQQQRRGNTVAARFDKRGSRATDDLNGGSARGGGDRDRGERGGGGGKHQKAYDDDDAANDGVPEDPRVNKEEGGGSYPQRGFGTGSSHYHHQRRPEEKRGGGGGGEYGSAKGFGGSKAAPYQAGGGSQLQSKSAKAVEVEEDWGKNANSPHFHSTEGGPAKPVKKTGRTFVNSKFIEKQFSGMHSDRLDGGGKNGGGSRDDERDYKQRGARSARD